MVITRVFLAHRDAIRIVPMRLPEGVASLSAHQRS